MFKLVPLVCTLLSVLVTVTALAPFIHMAVKECQEDQVKLIASHPKAFAFSNANSGPPKLEINKQKVNNCKTEYLANNKMFGVVYTGDWTEEPKGSDNWVESKRTVDRIKVDIDAYVDLGTFSGLIFDGDYMGYNLTDDEVIYFTSILSYGRSKKQFEIIANTHGIPHQEVSKLIDYALVYKSNIENFTSNCGAWGKGPFCRDESNSITRDAYNTMIHGNVKVMVEIIDPTLSEEKIRELYLLATNVESISHLSVSAVYPWDLYDVTLTKYFFSLFPESSLYLKQKNGIDIMLIIIICCSLLGLVLIIIAVIVGIKIYKKKQADLLDGMTPKEFVNQDNRTIQMLTDEEYEAQKKSSLVNLENNINLDGDGDSEKLGIENEYCEYTGTGSIQDLTDYKDLELTGHYTDLDCAPVEDQQALHSLP